jgi:MFS family permease
VTSTPLRQRQTSGSALGVAAFGTLLSLVVFTTPLSTLNATALGLGAGVPGRTWILSSMSIGLGAALLTTGTLADDVGRRRTFVAGMAVLAAGSLACGLVDGVEVFVLARIVQGVGAAAVIASSLGIIAHTFPPGPARAGAGGVWGASVGAGIALGPLVSSALESVASWRDAYWVSAVAAALVGAAAVLLVEESRAEERRGFDPWGAVLLGGGVTSLLVALVEGRDGWTQPPVLALAVGTVVLLVGFVAVEAATAAPMLDLSLVRQPAFVAATTAAFATGAGVIALLAYMSGFLGAALGVSAISSALLLLAWSATSVVTALLARRLPTRLSGRAQLAIGLLGVAAGQLLLTGVSGSTSSARFLPGLLLAGVFSGVLNAALGREAVASVPPGRGGMGSGANNTARYVGSAIGVTVVAVVAARPGPGSPTADLVTGWNSAVVVSAAVSVAGALVVLAARPRRQRSSAGRNERPPQPRRVPTGSAGGLT